MEIAENPIPTATTLVVTGMTCGACARTVERVLSRVPGVSSVTADFELGMAIVNGSASRSTLAAAVRAAGYGSSKDEGAVGGGKNDRVGSCCCS